MTYEEAMTYIQEAGKTGMSLGLDRMRELCRRLGNPQERLSFIHIAGTNGKGSTAAYISSILGVSGYMVGRYVSPAVFQYEECIQYEDGKGIHYIEKELLARCVTEVAVAVEQMAAEEMEPPTVFEIETAVSFLAFVHWQCQVVILEVGLGGKEDATNVIEEAIASVITPVSMDHKRVLGNTLEEIARQKAGIIKKEGRVITFQKKKTAQTVIEKEAEEKKAALTVLKKEDMIRISADLKGMVFSYQGENFRTRMPGSYQMENACLALEVCRQLPPPFSFTKEQLLKGIGRAVWRGRFEVISENPLIISDGAHNPDGAKALAETVRQLLPDKVLHGIMGVFQDKEYEKIVSYLASVFADVITITAPGGRGLDKNVLAEVWRKKGCPIVSTADSVTLALKEALNHRGEEEAVLLFGSLSFFRELAIDDFWERKDENGKAGKREKNQCHAHFGEK
ncbi:MAG: bifunctional folylpolyglutamate synthase/dihydrofolate synthase [Lachnospiraceae bacterium]|nr:bifunctional folylpolyglutamate synthase/dihydrofolate synthase [Lachnospiraceae bacterium]